MCNKCCLDVLVLEGQDTFVSNLAGETHEWWVEAKRCFQMNSDDALANHLLELATRLPISAFTISLLTVSVSELLPLVLPSGSSSLLVAIFSVIFRRYFCPLHNVIVYYLNGFIIKTNATHCPFKTQQMIRQKLLGEIWLDILTV